MRVLLFALASVLALALATLAQQVPEEMDDPCMEDLPVDGRSFRIGYLPILGTETPYEKFFHATRFRYPNPPVSTKYRCSSPSGYGIYLCEYSYYVWTPKACYTSTEAVPLWIEYVTRRKDVFSSRSPLLPEEERGWVLLIRRGNAVVVFKRPLPFLKTQDLSLIHI